MADANLFKERIRNVKSHKYSAPDKVQTPRDSLDAVRTDDPFVILGHGSALPILKNRIYRDEMCSRDTSLQPEQIAAQLTGKLKPGHS